MCEKSQQNIVKKNKNKLLVLDSKLSTGMSSLERLSVTLMFERMTLKFPSAFSTIFDLAATLPF